jgi:hypothetical protein
MRRGRLCREDKGEDKGEARRGSERGGARASEGWLVFYHWGAYDLTRHLPRLPPKPKQARAQATHAQTQERHPTPSCISHHPFDSDVSPRPLILGRAVRRTSTVEPSSVMATTVPRRSLWWSHLSSAPVKLYRSNQACRRRRRRRRRSCFHPFIHLSISHS